jgi:hypothetical protein
MNSQSEPKSHLCGPWLHDITGCDYSEVFRVFLLVFCVITLLLYAFADVEQSYGDQRSDDTMQKLPKREKAG